MPLFETSAKDDDKAYHVEAIFVTLAHKIKKRKTMLMIEGGRKNNNNYANQSKGKPIIYSCDDFEHERSRTCFWC